MTSRISTMAREEFWRHAERARTQGKDIAEVLDRQGFLLTPERIKNIRADAVEQVIQILEETPVSTWTTYGTTRLDMLNSIIRTLREVAKDYRKE